MAQLTEPIDDAFVGMDAWDLLGLDHWTIVTGLIVTRVTLGGYCKVKIAIRGEDANGDPYLLMPGLVLDRPELAGPVAKERVEDMQIWRFLHSLGVYGLSRHPIAVEIGADPPDRRLRYKTQSWGVELTELTLAHIRPNLSRFRKVGRDLHARIASKPSKYPHLAGKVVSLFSQPDEQLPRNVDGLIAEIEEALLDENGYMAEEFDLDPDQPVLPVPRGLYGRHGPFLVLAIRRSDQEGKILVSASASVKIGRREALETLTARILAKDTPGNDILLVTCGSPDRQGYICPVDAGIFDLLTEAGKDRIDLLPNTLSHVRGVAIQDWNNNDLILLGESALPWSTPNEFRTDKEPAESAG